MATQANSAAAFDPAPEKYSYQSATIIPDVEITNNSQDNNIFHYIANTMRPLTPGLVIANKYQLLEQIGRGSYGVVWKASDTELSTSGQPFYVAVKLLPPEIAASLSEIEKIKANFRQVYGLHHPHIAAHLSLVGFDQQFALILEYVQGQTLNHYFSQLRTSHDINAQKRQALEITRQIASALDFAHSRQLAHRDIKPDNIMVMSRQTEFNSSGTSGLEQNIVVKLLDFGLATEINDSLSRVTNYSQEVVGSRPYMSPEQWLGQRPQKQSDQYALAVVYYELLSSHPPFFCSDPAVLRQCVLTGTVQPLAVLSARQNQALLRALAKNPQERFNSCLELTAALESGSVSPVTVTINDYSNNKEQADSVSVAIPVALPQQKSAQNNKKSSKWQNLWDFWNSPIGCAITLNILVIFGLLASHNYIDRFTIAGYKFSIETLTEIAIVFLFILLIRYRLHHKRRKKTKL